jgi:peptide/nickel transport system substrate-binding protein
MNRFFSISTVIKVIETAKTSDRWLLRLLLVVVFGALVWFMLVLNQTVSVPGISAGGSFTEGIIGTPRFVNPVLALSRADQDMTALTYSGLMKIGNDGTLVPDVASTVEVSPDGTTYSIELRENVNFHDGEAFTSDDVLFTINLIQNNDLKSPLRGNWSDVVVEAVDDYNLLVTISEPYAPFIENFTVGILPAHIWRDIPIEQVPFSEFNTTPVGTGPYRVSDATFSRSGTVEEYHLSAANNYHQVLISEMDVRFYSNEAALLAAMNEGDVDATAYLSAERADLLETGDWNITEQPLPRMFGLFFNQNRSTVLRDAAVREALEAAIDRTALINNTLGGAGIPSPNAVALSQTAIESGEATTQMDSDARLTQARSILEAADWTLTEQGFWEKEVDDATVPLEVTVRTANTPELNAVLQEITTAWRTLGVAVETEQYEQTDLVQSVIRPREFSILLFGIDMSRSQDLYPFWHSSQQNDPGLNIAQYANISVDELLETARTSQDNAERLEAQTAASEIITEERPAIFLFQPSGLYVTRNDLNTTLVQNIGRDSDRFSSIESWHTDTSSLWPIFRNEATSP